jgi:Domain of unknown function (DUF397)
MIDNGDFRSSTFSDAGNCVNVGTGFRTSSFSFANGNCVEAGQGDEVVLIRDTKQREQGYPVMLSFSLVAWRSFTTDIKSR